MSIASRITSIEGHIEEDYNTLERLGADLTNVDKNIENIASVVNDIYDRLPKVTGTGSDLSLTPTLKGGLNILPLGNCEQDTYTGKNLFVIPETTTYREVTLTKNNNGTFNIKGTATGGSATFQIYVEKTLTSGSYTLSKNNTNNNLQLYVQDRNNQSWISNLISLESGSSVTSSITPTGNQTYFAIGVPNGATVDLENVEVQLESGSSVTSWEPYVGGIPSPNPSYPQDVKVVTGDNEVVVCNKNLLKFYRTNDDSQYGTFENDTYTSNNRLGLAVWVFKKEIEDNASFVVSYNSASNAELKYALDDTDVSASNEIGALTNSGIGVNITNGTVIRNWSNKKYLYISFRTITTGTTASVEKLQLEYGSTATSYVAHQEQSTTLNLGSLELSKIGDYQDVITGSKDNWKVVRKVGKIVLNGSEETWYYEGGGAPYAITMTNMFRDNSTAVVLSNLFMGVSYSSSWSLYDYLLSANTSANTTPAIRIKYDTNALTLNEFKTWLSTHNTTVYYILATPTEETITDTTLINELNELQELLSYDGTTNITITSASTNAQMLVQVSALKGE